MFRPHWRHKQCGGIVAGCGNEFKCTVCGETGSAIGAPIPGNTVRHGEYFNCHPELAVVLLDEAPATDTPLRGAGYWDRSLEWLGRLVGRLVSH